MKGSVGRRGINLKIEGEPKGKKLDCEIGSAVIWMKKGGEKLSEIFVCGNFKKSRKI